MPHMTDRQRVEALLLPQMMLGVFIAGVSDPEAPDAISCKANLVAASEDALQGLDDKTRSKLLRRMFRVHEAVTLPYRNEDARVDKMGLIVYYLLAAILDSGYMTLADGSHMSKALDVLLPALEPAANITKLDMSAQKAYRKLLHALQLEGYFPTVKML